MTAEEYLDQIKKLDAIITNKSEEYRRLTELSEGLGNFSVAERVQSTRNLQQIPNCIAKYIDLEREIDDLKRKRAEIIKTIEQLPSIEYKLIYKLYVKDFTLKEIAYDFDRSYEWVKKHKRKALRMVQSMIDKG
jgi:DNA-directed RNA polymerase specialized sigma24 family protein